MFVLKSTQCTIKMDLFHFSLFKHKMFLDLERKEHKSTLRGRETFCTTIGARAGGHLGFVGEDPLKGGDEQCREVDAGPTVSKTVTATAGGSRLKYGGGFPTAPAPP